MSLGIYRFAYLCFWALGFPLSVFSKKLRQGLKGRRGLNSRLKQAKYRWTQARLSSRPYWFHFASAGELEQAIPIAEEIKKREPSAAILFTYFSPSGAKGVELEKKRRERANKPLPWDHADYLPLDLPWQIKSVLKTVFPKAIVLINRELWPELMVQARAQQIPLYLFSAFFPGHSHKMLKLWRPYLKHLKQIGTVGESSTELLLKTDPQLKVQSIGDTRIERVLERKSLQAAPPAWGTFLETKSLFIGASLWKEDFEALKPSIQKITQEFPHWRVCLVPHEPEDGFINEIKSWGKEQGIAFRRFSHFLETPDEVSPLIMDRVGLLAELYRYSDLAFVGGSFKKRVHNVLEPAAYENAIVVGPYIQNSFEATEMNRLNQGLCSVENDKKLGEAILKRISDVSFVKSEGLAAHHYLMDRRGPAAAYCDLL